MKYNLVRSGYLPEILPPIFSSEATADFFENKAVPIKKYKTQGYYNSSVYSASQFSGTRRIFSIIHPVSAVETAEFIENNRIRLVDFFKEFGSRFSKSILSVDSDSMVNMPNLEILEEKKYEVLSSFEFITQTDISRFYHSLYTHVIPWAYQSKEKVKKLHDMRKFREVKFDLADKIIRKGQGRQTIGIPVGPAMSYIFAELVCCAIDKQFNNLMKVESIGVNQIDFELIRFNDDVWIGSNSMLDAKIVAEKYREAVQHFELDLNESKTNIFAQEFKFTNQWEFEISQKVCSDLSEEDLRSILEFSYLKSVSIKSQRVLKYTLNKIVENDLIYKEEHWKIVEPFLMRVFLNSGYVIDQVIKLILWRNKVYKDINLEKWKRLFVNLLEKNSIFGYDNEICWVLFACQVLKISIPINVAKIIIKNCGSLPVILLINFVKKRLVRESIITQIIRQIENEDDSGKYWPVFLELNKIGKLTRPEFKKCKVMEEMYSKNISIIDSGLVSEYFKKSSNEKSKENLDILLSKFNTFD